MYCYRTIDVKKLVERPIKLTQWPAKQKTRTIAHRLLLDWHEVENKPT